ncbi:MAG: hypothetical protein ACFCU4_11845 [Puniceicoccaceae bacterium]
MLQTTREKIQAFLGTPLSHLGRVPFNAEDSLRFQDKVYFFEIGFLDKLSVYVVAQKLDNSTIDDLEARGLRAISGSVAEWVLLTKATREFDINDPVNDLKWAYRPAKKDDRIVRELLCSHQQRRRQLVIFDPLWRPDLNKIAATRL